MSASLVRATVRAVSKRKLQPTRAALTLTPSAVNKIKQLLKDKPEHVQRFSQLSSRQEHGSIQAGLVEEELTVLHLHLKADFLAARYHLPTVGEVSQAQGSGPGCMTYCVHRGSVPHTGWV
ncbi:iron-sulfur cluster assembly 1 homolog, mitochondrial isoform X3 [Apodemus sylvaticus]|uniref:iron-sulfur cluster assembly 1 homolog, mitochondrial isoform X3 n=1 Tax=Apodemus sylvaticus TaxID=10129 RepID=UPI0022436C58|nr:iron-sulfur cluster assembly 1 homolog, mitochondrial isoform X3 [Apodemus sylvaticus]